MVWQLEQREETYANSQESWPKLTDWISSVIHCAWKSIDFCLLFSYPNFSGRCIVPFD